MTYPEQDKAVHAFGEAMHDVLMSLPENDRFKKAKANLMDDIWQEMEYGVIDRMSEAIEGFVRSMAGRVIEEIIAGREDQMRRYLKLDGYNGRSDHGSPYISEKKPEDVHPVIHGDLFENHCIETRRKMAQAHADLIQNERIKDLEDQVASLVAQVRDRDRKIARLQELA